MTWIARNAGEETVGGFSAPPWKIVNVAGTRAFVEPPAGAADRVEPGEADAEALDAAPDAREDAAPDALADALEDACPDGLEDGLAVAIALEETDAVLEPELTAGLAPDELVPLELARCPEPPQPTTETSASASPRQPKRRLTF